MYIGIDLGTTYSVAAVVNEAGVPEIIQITQDSITTPSAVYIGRSGRVSIGVNAKKHGGKAATFYKRTIGQDAANYYPENGQQYSSVELSSIFLKEFASRIKEITGEKIDGAVITVPAYFEEREKSNTRKAAEEAGINVIHMVNEPTAAVTAYGLKQEVNKKVLVFDLGGGTFDVSVANITKEKIEIIATIGDFQLGGRDWDKEICRWAAEQFEEKFGVNFSGDSEQMDALMIDAENLKKNLTESTEADILIKSDDHEGVFTLSRAKFEEKTRNLLERTGSLINKMFEEKNLSWKDIDEIILVGSSTRMPMVKNYIKEISGKEARLHNPEGAVACGAALMANSIGKSKEEFELDFDEDDFVIPVGDRKIEDVNSHSLGLIVAKEAYVNGEKCRIYYNEIMIRKNTALKDAQMTKAFRLNSDTQDIYLTQWESDSLPEKESIIGKYQVEGITPNEPFSVTYFHNPDGTVGIKAEQSGIDLSVSKVLDYCDRDFEPEPVAEPAKGIFMIAVDLSGSMGTICTQAPEYRELLARIDNGTLNEDELLEAKEEFEKIKKFIKNNIAKRYIENGLLASQMKVSAIGLAKKFIKDFVKKFPIENVSFGIVGFADSIKDFCEPTHNSEAIFKAIDELIISYEVTGFSNNAQPMYHMFDILAKKKERENLDFAYAIVLTDGDWSTRASNDALRARSRYIREGIEIIVQGFGEANEDFVRNLATVEEFADVGDIVQLGEKFDNIAEVLKGQFYLP